MFCGCPEGASRTDIPHKTATRFLCAVGVNGNCFHNSSLEINLPRLMMLLLDGACLSCSAVAPKGRAEPTSRIKPHCGFMPVGVNGYCFHNSSLRMLLSLRDQSADWSWQSVPHAAGCRHPALRIKLNLCRAGPACPAGRVPWLTGGGLRAARPTDSRKIYASPGSSRRDAGPYRQKQKVLAVGPMWGANRAPPVADEAR